MNQHITSVTFPAANGGPLLEGRLHPPAGPASVGLAVVCHPHPHMGGTMDSSVVTAVCRALAAQGWLALRFNFRDAGRRLGAFEPAQGQTYLDALDDVAGAIDWLLARQKAAAGRVAVVGYSFGAEMGLRHAVRDPRVGWLAGIALVQEHYADAFLDDERRPKLFITGEHDAWAPPDAMRTYVARLKPPKTMHVVSGTDHFFAGYEDQVAARVVDFLETYD